MRGRSWAALEDRVGVGRSGSGLFGGVWGGERVGESWVSFGEGSITVEFEWRAGGISRN